MDTQGLSLINNMNDFDARAQSWDSNPMHWERSEAIATRLLQMVPVNPTMNALEFGAGTGILSSMLSPFFSTITMVDQSIEMVRMMQQKVQDRKFSKSLPLHSTWSRWFGHTI
jgi:ubiquinone/menaquinone biosynthesis C-methylase UbiE